LSDQPEQEASIVSWIEELRNQALYFDESAIDLPVEYVSWIDVMGSENTMLRSLPKVSNFVMKLHMAALMARDLIYNQSHYNIDLFPVIDGVYACSRDKLRIFDFINRVYTKLAEEFISEANPEHRFVIRGCLAFGPILKGRDATMGSPFLATHVSYAERILLGMPMIQAFNFEGKASPFGVYLHESVRAFSPPNVSPLTGLHWNWWSWVFNNQPTDSRLLPELNRKLEEYYTWCRSHASLIDYPLDNIDRHQSLARQYLQND
jgi:hypothetical protein